VEARLFGVSTHTPRQRAAGNAGAFGLHRAGVRALMREMSPALLESLHGLPGEAWEGIHALLLAVIEEIGHPITLHDREGRLLGMNRAGRELHGYQAKDETFGRTTELADLLEFRNGEKSTLPPEQWPANRARGAS
jgi:PAS domain-containing protein